MQKMSERLPRNFESEESIKSEFERLVKIYSILTEMGFKVWEYAGAFEGFKQCWDDGMAFPLVWDESNGIRASINTDRGLVIWFTNGLEEADNPKRIAVVEKLKAENLWNRK